MIYMKKLKKILSNLKNMILMSRTKNQLKKLIINYKNKLQ